MKTGFRYYYSEYRDQTNKDDWLLNQRYGVDAGGNKLPVVGGTWWFFPSNITKLSGSNFYTRLFNFGINVMLFVYRKGQNDRNYNDPNQYQWLTAVASDYKRHPEIYKRFPANPDCPVAPEWVV